MEEIIDTELDGLPLLPNVAGQVRPGETMASEIARRMQEVLASDAATLESAGLHVDDWIARVLEEAPARFDGAFGRWRELYQTAQRQLRTAQKTLERARGRQQQAEAEQRQRLALEVRSTHNLMLVRLARAADQDDRVVRTTLQYALQRGCEQEFELEVSELDAEQVGDGAMRAILLHETAEGGAGVLRRLVSEPDAIARVARAALERCHFDPEGVDQHEGCEAACYECLLSFGNQYDALRLDRHRVKSLLLDLAASKGLPRSGGRDWDAHLQWLRGLTDARSDLERRLLDVLAAGRRRLPDDAQRRIDDAGCIPDFFYGPNVCVFCDGAVHDDPVTAGRDRHVRDNLVGLGYRVIVIRYDQRLDEQVARHPEVFGSR